MNREYEIALRQGLVGNKHAHLYCTSASFQQSVDTLVMMLPAMIDGLAARAVATDEVVQRSIQLLKEMKLDGIKLR
jgi:hypothetical protein